jgi:hypothetical protein
MTWNQIVEYEDAVLLKHRQTKKKVWNNITSTWRDVTIWTVDYEQDTVTWLEQSYANRAGWGTIGDRKIIMEEPVYLHYCLART